MGDTPARWPRLLSEDAAAEYVGVSVSQFRLEQARGMWPRPIERGCRRNTYDRHQLDAAVDRMAGVQGPGRFAEKLGG